MALPKVHELQAKHNYIFLKFIERKKDFIDWHVTVAYYTAIHIVDSKISERYLELREKQLKTFSDKGIDMHAIRDIAVRRYLTDIYTSFKLLREQSKTARYLENTSGTEIASKALKEQDVKELLTIHLENIIKRFGLSFS